MNPRSPRTLNNEKHSNSLIFLFYSSKVKMSITIGLSYKKNEKKNVYFDSAILIT